MKIYREVVITVLIALAVFICLRFTVQSYTVQYTCMLPNIEEGDWVMVSKASYFFSDPQRGDVVVFEPPVTSKYPFIKRVIGLPGEIVEIKDGKVIIDGIPLEEEYIMAPPNYTMLATEVLDKEYFVLGDNRPNSNDSHYGWTVPRDNVIGKAWFIYWPPSKLGVVKHYSYAGLNETGEQEMIVGQSIEVQLE
jgi:signal peptidase I